MTARPATSASARANRRLARLVVALLVSTAGLLCAGGFGLWRAARDGEALARGAAERALFAAARALPSRFADPAALPADPLDPARFELRDGALVAPPAVRPWPLSPLDPDLDLAPPLLELLDEAARAAEPEPLLDRAQAMAQRLAVRQQIAVRNAAAWQAERAGDADRRDLHLAALLELLPPLAAASAAPPFAPLDAPPAAPYASDFAGALLLAALHAPSAPLLAEPEAALASLEPAARGALLARLAERSPPAEPSPAQPSPPAPSPVAGTLHAKWRDAAARVARRESVAALLAPHLPRLAQRRTPLLEPLGDGWLLYQPELGERDALEANDASGVGHGALLTLAELFPSARRDGDGHGAGGSGDGDSGGWRLDDPELAPGGPVRLVAAEPLPAAALPLAPGLGVVALPLPPPGLLASTGVLATLLAAFGAALAATLLLVVRAVRRDAAATAARSRFLTSVTHELKTPLASIRLLSELLVERRADAAKQHEYHRLLAGESERLSALIENVLDVGALEREERALAIELQPLAPLLRDVVKRVAPLLERDGLAVALSLPSEEPAASAAERLPLRVPLDRGAFSQIVINLLDNARKYAAGGGRVEVALAARPGGGATVRVRDHGPGIAAADRASLFEPFVRGAAQADGATPGLGLGLHLARTLARRHGGELECVAPSDGGAGACFELTLPNGAASGGGGGEREGRDGGGG
ncbi:MAG: HAMP domain-containing histidine kinase [Planctomycetes bacterium]|nr:HAMP domain-containing histidine kinase [Planctomycetota bacterium]